MKQIDTSDKRSYFFKKKLFIWLCPVLAVACGIEFSDWRLNPGFLHWECRVLAAGPLEKSQGSYLKGGRDR